MKTWPLVSVSRPARQCISVDLPEPGRAHDGGELPGGEVDVDAVEGPHLAVAAAVHLGCLAGRLRPGQCVLAPREPLAGGEG